MRVILLDVTGFCMVNLQLLERINCLTRSPSWRNSWIHWVEFLPRSTTYCMMALMGHSKCKQVTSTGTMYPNSFIFMHSCAYVCIQLHMYCFIVGRTRSSASWAQWCFRTSWLAWCMQYKITIYNIQNYKIIESTSLFRCGTAICLIFGLTVRCKQADQNQYLPIFTCQC